MSGVSSPTDSEAIYAELRPLVRRLIRQYGQDREMRQDLQGEIFWLLSVLLEQYEPERGIPLRPYLARKLTTSVYTYARRHWRRRGWEVTVGADYPEVAAEEEIDPARGWDQCLLNQEVLFRLPQAMERLSVRQRYVLISRFYDGRTFEDIAASLGVCPATARSFLRHALTRLRRYYTQAGLVPE